MKKSFSKLKLKIKTMSSANLSNGGKENGPVTASAAKPQAAVITPSRRVEESPAPKRRRVSILDYVQSVDLDSPKPDTPHHLKDEANRTPFTKIQPHPAIGSEPKRKTSEKQELSEAALCAKFGRHIVISVEQVNPMLKELRLEPTASTVRSSRVKRCTLKGSWADTTQVKEGDIVNVLNVVNDRADDDAVVIDDQNGLLVVNPDHLVSGTSIVSSLFCMRKAVLNENFKGIEGSSRTMLIGTLVHELLQECLRNGARDEADISKQVNKSLTKPSIIQDMLTLGMTEKEMRSEIEPFLPHLLFFIEKYVNGKDVKPPDAAYSNTGGGGSQRSFGGRPPPPPQIWPGNVEAINDIEENIWSPRLGIKGKVDLTIQVKLKQKDKKGRLCKTLPLELKTGRPSGSAEHRGQVILYSMLMSERRQDPEAGLLLYLRTSSMQEVQAGIHEMRGLVQLRNQLVVNLNTDTSDLPEPINAKRACRDCGHLNTCSMYQKLNDKIPEAPHAMADLVPQTLAHLTEEDLAFFNNWSQMCALETGEARKASRLKSLWCSTPGQREQQGVAISGLSLLKTSDGEDLKHVFERSMSVLTSVFQPGETVLVSTDDELALAQGYLVSVQGARVTVVLDRDLQGHYNKTFTFDKFEYSSNSNGVINLAKLMTDTPKAKHLRDILMKRTMASFIQGLPKSAATQSKHILKPLNRVQQKAAFKSLMAEQFVLLKGMPGSGKTTLIVALVRMLVNMGKSVLLTAYTHSAVDTILMKLVDFDDVTPKILRLGKATKTREKVRQFCVENLTQGLETPDAVDALYKTKSVVATTCLSINHPSVTKRTFDYCILDEAGQSLLLAALGPLLHADKFILVGDPQQLPPVVKSSKAKALGMDTSLFSHLQEESNTIPLTVQYRMNKEIQALANHLSYDGQLECGNDLVENRKIVLVKELEANSPSWLSLLFSENSSSVVFANFDASSESIDEMGVCNVQEANAVAKIAKLAISSKVAVADDNKKPTVGLIAPYRAQVSMLRKLLTGSITSGDISTVDQFQGRDKDIIIYSCTKTKPKNPNGNRLYSEGSLTVGKDDIMSDFRRLNVAVTRAKAKLIIVGHKQALHTYAPFKEVIDYLDKEGKIIDIIILKSHDEKNYTRSTKNTINISKLAIREIQVIVKNY